MMTIIWLIIGLIVAVISAIYFSVKVVPHYEIFENPRVKEFTITGITIICLLMWPVVLIGQIFAWLEK